MQDTATGLSAAREHSLTEVFSQIDRQQRGHFTVDDLQSFAGSFGVQTLSQQELVHVFSGFGTDPNNQASALTLSQLSLFISHDKITLSRHTAGEAAT